MSSVKQFVPLKLRYMLCPSRFVADVSPAQFDSTAGFLCTGIFGISCTPLHCPALEVSYKVPTCWDAVPHFPKYVVPTGFGFLRSILERLWCPVSPGGSVISRTVPR